MRSRKRLLLSALILASLPWACTRPTPAPAPPPAPEAPAPDQGPVRLRYSAPWGGLDIRLLGVDPQQNHAWIWKGDRRKQHQALELVQIDLATGQRLQQWKAQPDKARQILHGYPTLRPWSDDLEADAARLAQVVRHTGPWSTRGRPVPPALAWSQSQQVMIHEGSPTHGQDGDWLFTRSADGELLGRLDQGMRASYSPSVSPDGQTVAWRACSPQLATRGKNCNYALATAALRPRGPSAAPTLHPGVPKPTAPIWSPSGEHLLTIARPRGRACLVRLPLAPPQEPKELHCQAEARDPAFAQSPSGRQGVMLTVQGDPQAPSLRFDWLDLAQDKLLGTWGEPGATGEALWVDDDTLAWLRRDGALVLLRPERQQRAVIPAQRGHFAGLSMTQRLHSGALVLLRLHPGGFDVVEVDLEAAFKKAHAGL